jgi:hypothetical protein
MSAPNLQVGARHPTEVPGVHSVVGKTQRAKDGWFRRDTIVIGVEEIGAVHVKEVNGRITALSMCGDAGVIGRDVGWIVRTSGKTPQVAPATPVPAAPLTAGTAPRRMRP